MESSKIMLNENEREELERFAKKGVHSAKLITRAKTILALDRSNKKEHLRINRICEQVGITRQSLNEIRKAFISAPSVSEFLTRKKRETPPVEPKVTGDVEAHIIALACSEPPQGYARWSLRLLANRSVELGYIDSISHVAVRRVLKKRNINLT